MNKLNILFLCLVSLFTVSISNISLADEGKWSRLVNECGYVLSEIQQMPDEYIPNDLLKKAEAIAIFPSTLSGGFGLGAKYGKGIIMVRNANSKNTWSSPALFTLMAGSLGFQIGGQATDFVLLIMNRRSIDGLLDGKFKLGADASVAAGPVGRAAEASTDIHLKGGILSYSRSRGLFAGVKLEGAVLKQHEAGNAKLYGQFVTAREILLKNKTTMPESASKLLVILKEYKYEK